jgi:predicted nucleotidyltransferase component of viral defense system
MGGNLMLREITDRAIQRYSDPQMRLNYVREQLQQIILTALHEAYAFKHIAFVGGTCLRIIHGLRRYSEDLDFSLVNGTDYDFQDMLRKVNAKLNALGIEHTIKANIKNTVHSAQAGFPTVRRMVGENPMESAKLTIKLEIDTNPPEGWITEHHIQRSDFGLAAVVSYDLASLFAGKLHALCCRNYTKGRDWYDLVWYLTQKPAVSPNLAMLTNSVAQTEGAAAWDGADWKARLQDRLKQLDLTIVKADIAPFIERKEELQIFSANALLTLVTNTKLT